MAKKLDLNKPVFELVQEYPELVDVLKDLGFSEITKPAMLNSVGRITTIPKGAKMRNISMMKVVPALMSNGFELIGKMPNIFALGKNNAGDETSSEDGAFQENTREKIKSYLKRLGEGEDLESVRKDFVENFSEVEASEIMKAEQELIKEGTPITEVQKLCDVHSALFHGATKEEKIANAEKAVEESLKKEETSKKLMPDAYNQKHAAAKTLRETVGHPMYRWALENEKIAALIHEIQGDIESGNDVGEKLSELRQISIHYAEKGDLVYPVLKVRYEISGPSDVMWTVDDEIRDELAALDKISDYDEEWMNRLQTVLKRADEMIYKEANILFPNCAFNFTDEEWFGIYRDSKDYAECLGVENGVWEDAEKAQDVKTPSISQDEIVMAGGHMTVEQLTAMLNTIPLEISFVDTDNINRFFNEGPKVFKRPGMAIDREVFSCHPPKIEQQVRRIIEEFRAGTLDKVPVWMDKNGRTMLVTYMAVRDKSGKYLGTMELVQDMEFAKEYFQK